MKPTIFFLLLTAITSAATSQALKPWKLNFPVGQAYSVTNTMENSLNQQVMGQNMNMTSSAVSQSEFSVRSADSEGFRVEQTFYHLKTDMQVMGQKMSIDSDNTDDLNGPVGEPLKNLIGSTMEALIYPNGQSRILKGIVMPEGFSMGTGINDPSQVSTFYVVPPSKAIRKNGTWTENTELEGVKIQVTYQYKKSANGKAHLNYEMTAEIVQTATANNIEIQTNMITTGKGSIVLELASGLVLERSYEGSLSGKSKAMGMEIPQKGTQKVIMIMAQK